MRRILKQLEAYQANVAEYHKDLRDQCRPGGFLVVGGVKLVYELLKQESVPLKVYEVYNLQYNQFSNLATRTANQPSAHATV